VALLQVDSQAGNTQYGNGNVQAINSGSGNQQNCFNNSNCSSTYIDGDLSGSFCARVHCSCKDAHTTLNLCVGWRSSRFMPCLKAYCDTATSDAMIGPEKFNRHA